MKPLFEILFFPSKEGLFHRRLHHPEDDEGEPDPQELQVPVVKIE